MRPIPQTLEASYIIAYPYGMSEKDEAYKQGRTHLEGKNYGSRLIAQYVGWCRERLPWPTAMCSKTLALIGLVTLQH